MGYGNQRERAVRIHVVNISGGGNIGAHSYQNSSLLAKMEGI